MKYYLKTHYLKFLFCNGILAFLILLLGLADSFSGYLLGYLLGLGCFLFLVLFGTDYFRKRHLYAFLSNRTKGIIADDSDLESKRLRERVNHLLKEQEQQIRQKEKAKQQQITFMNLWVHQMKTPVSVLEIMAQENQLDNISVLKETQRLKTGLNLALNEARLSEGLGNDFLLKQLSLSKIVTQMINEQKYSFIQHHIYPEVSIPEDMLVISDEKWLTFIIEQLLINGIKYSTRQGKLLINGVVVHSVPMLSITDFGVGIPTEDLPRVKQAFFTGTNGRLFGEATGMGLYLVEQAAKELGITVDIQSEVSKGTEVTLYFPTNC